MSLAPSLYVEVVIAAKTPNTYTYAVPHDLDVSAGDRVLIPFGRGKRVGVVLGPGEVGAYEIKEILSCLTRSAMAKEDLEWLDWLSRYHHVPLGLVYQTALPSLFWQHDGAWEKPQGYQISALGQMALSGKKISLAQRRALTWLKDIDAVVSLEAIQDQSITQATLNTMIKNQWIDVRPFDRCLGLVPEPRPYPLHPDQQAMIEAWPEQGFHIGLLHGVTGSGKTEVYCELAQQVMRRGQKVLILVPEIGLTPQTVRRFQRRCGGHIGVWHSQLSERERARVWLHAHHQSYQMIIGTRSAAFLPMQNLGLILIDESHDASFKQYNGLRYLATKALMMRARHHDCPILLGSATPSLSSLQQVCDGKMKRYLLKERVGGGEMPHIQCVDMRAQSIKGGLSAPLLAHMKRHIEQGHQVLVFLNRRGYAPALLCHLCGWHAECEHCQVNMTVHKASSRLVCHHCGHEKPLPDQCPVCVEPSLVDVGLGTERLEEVLLEHFPEVKQCRIDRDTMKSKKIWDQTLEKIEKGDLQLLVGTQMLAKGHHWPNLKLVAIIDVDAQLYSSDVMALERLGQTIWQVAGRAGRTEKGEVVLQTHWPNHPFFTTLLEGGYHALAQWLLKERKQFALPPFSHHAVLRMRSKKACEVQTILSQFQSSYHGKEVSILGPYPEAMMKKAGMYHYWLWMQANNRALLHQAVADGTVFLNQHSKRSMHWSFDVEPMSLG